MDDIFGDDFAAAGDAEFAAAATKQPGKFAKRQFTCQSCHGTGKWAGGCNRYGNAKCNACQGQGYFVTSPEQRAKARASAASTKARKAEAAQAANVDALGGAERLVALQQAGQWSEFAASLYAQHAEGKALSDKQAAAAGRMLDKLEANAAAKAAAKVEREANAPTVDLSAIEAMFATALASGYKRPMYRALGLRIKPGKAGALYVLTEDRMELGHYGEQPGYEGKIAERKFLAVRAAAPDTADKLARIAADPKGEAIRHGQRTGTCSCCGRELTKHASIEAGIGPICAAKWGL